LTANSAQISLIVVILLSVLYYLHCENEGYHYFLFGTINQLLSRNDVAMKNFERSVSLGYCNAYLSLAFLLFKRDRTSTTIRKAVNLINSTKDMDCTTEEIDLAQKFYK